MDRISIERIRGTTKVGDIFKKVQDDNPCHEKGLRVNGGKIDEDGCGWVEEKEDRIGGGWTVQMRN